MNALLFDVAGRRRSPATFPGYHRGRSPRNKGLRYPADPPSVEEIAAVMRTAGSGVEGARTRALIVLLCRAGLRISEALALAESDLDRRRGSILVRRGKGGKRREVGMDRWGWDGLQPWLDLRTSVPVGALLCVIHGPTRGRPWSATAARAQLRRLAASAGVRRRFAPHQLRHAHAVEMAREGVPLVVIQHQLGHANPGITSVYLQGIDPGRANARALTARHFAWSNPRDTLRAPARVANTRSARRPASGTVRLLRRVRRGADARLGRHAASFASRRLESARDDRNGPKLDCASAPTAALRRRASGDQRAVLCVGA